MAARAYVERDTAGFVRAVCRETGASSPFTSPSKNPSADDRRALVLLSDVCECDEYHSAMEDDMHVPGVEKKAVLEALEAEARKAKATMMSAQFAAEKAIEDLKRAEQRRRELEELILAGESVVDLDAPAEVVATGVFSSFSPNASLRLELVQGLKEDDPMRHWHPRREDSKAALEIKVEDGVKVERDQEWHVLVLMRRIKPPKRT